MNRVIKFRGRLKNSNEWKYGSLLTYADGECNIITETGHRIDTWNVDPSTVGQFTGLLDRNGKEIYEGDILRGALHNHVVKFKNGIFFAEVEDEYGYDCIKPTLFKATEIIGNIHDNPELMGNEQSKS